MIDKIANYVINNKYDTPNAVISYISMVEDSYESVKLQNIMENRNISVDVILGERPESDLSLRYDNDYITATITPRIFTLNVNGIYYKSLVDVEDSTFNLLNNLTSGSNILDINTSKLSYLEAKQNIQTTLTKCVYGISKDLRRSGVCSILMSSDMIDYGIGNIHHADVTFTNKIPKGKVIVMNTEKNCGIGLNLIINEEKSIYYLKETPDYSKAIRFFNVK